MKKAAISIVFICISVLAFSHAGVAAEQREIYEYQYDAYGVADINDAVPEAAEDFAASETLQVENTGALLDIKKVLSWCVETLFTLFKSKKKFFIQLATLLILLYIVKTLCSGLSRDKAVQALHYFAVVCACVLVFDTVFSVSQKLIGTLEQLTSFTSAALPVMTGLVSASGMPASAAGIGGTGAFILNILAFIGSTCILPAINVYMVLGLGACLSENENLKAVSVFCRNICIFIITLLFCIFIGVISLQSAFTGSADSLSKRAIMFTAGNFVPIAGGYVSEGVNVVFSCASALKGTVGVFSAAILFFTAASPIADIVISMLLMSVAKMFCAFFDNKRLSALFDVVKDAFAMMFTAAVGTVLMLIVCMAVMAKIGG